MFGPRKVTLLRMKSLMESTETLRTRQRMISRSDALNKLDKRNDFCSHSPTRQKGDQVITMNMTLRSKSSKGAGRDIICSKVGLLVYW